MADIDLEGVGYIVVALFVVTWAVAFAVRRLGRIEQRWSASPLLASRLATFDVPAPAQTDALATRSERRVRITPVRMDQRRLLVFGVRHQVLVPQIHRTAWSRGRESG